MYSWLENFAMRAKGPVPTGLALTKVSGLLIFDHTCCGMIAVLFDRSCGRTVVLTVLKVKDTWLLPTCAILVIWPFCMRPVSSAIACCLPYLKVNTTSAAVKGLPSDHFTPLRMVRSRVLLWLIHL